MKIIMIGSHLRVNGGITRVVKNYLDAGLDKKIYLEYYPTYFGSNHVINVFYYVLQYIKLILKLYIFKHYFDVAHIHMSYRGSFVRKKYIINLLVKKKIPIILHMHGSQFKEFFNQKSPYQKQKIKNTLNKVDIIIALGEQWKEYYQTLCESEVISIDNAVFPKELINIKEEKIYITTMGVLSKRKGTYDLIKVASKIKGKIDPKYKFLIAGDGEIDKVKRMIRELELEDMFEIPGWISSQEKIEQIYRKSIVYVLPSYNEGMPMSILEAMSYGLPIVTTPVGAISSLVKENENGFIVNPGDIDSIEKRLLYLINNPDLVKRIEKYNIDKIKNKYNVYNSIEKIINLYKKLTNIS